MLPEKFSEMDDGVAIDRAQRKSKFSVANPHYRNEYQIHYILDGCRYFFDNRQQYPLSAGSIALVDKWQIPKTNILGGEYHDRILLEIKEDRLFPLSQIMGFDMAAFFRTHHGVLVLDQEQQTAVEGFIGHMLREMQDKQVGYHARVQILVMELVIYLARSGAPKAPILSTRTTRMSKDLKVHEIADYIINHHHEIISLDMLAKLFYLDKCYLSRIFKDITNFTVCEFLNQQRTKHAKQLLLQTQKPIQEIALQVGYESLTYFERVFHAETGFAPLRYRKEMQKKEKPGRKAM